MLPISYYSIRGFFYNITNLGRQKMPPLRACGVGAFITFFLYSSVVGTKNAFFWPDPRPLIFQTHELFCFIALFCLSLVL
jgi:hypothetical protein